MIAVSLNWYQRISLWLRIGTVQAPNMRIASVLYRVIEKIRPSDEEQETTNLVVRPNGYEWQLPSAVYGTREVELEAEEAEALANMIENPPQELPVLVNDAGWMLKLIDQLRVKQQVAA